MAFERFCAIDLIPIFDLVFVDGTQVEPRVLLALPKLLRSDELIVQLGRW